MCSFCSWATTPFFQGLFKGSHRCTLPLLGKTTDVTFGASLIIAVRLNPAPVQTCAQRNTRVDWALQFRLWRRTVLFQISIQIISCITWNKYNISVLHKNIFDKWCLFSETHEVISTMLWGFVIVIKRNGTDGSTFPMVNEVKLRPSEKTREEWSCSGVPPWARGRLRHQDPASSCLQGACKDKSPSRRSKGIPSQFIIWRNGCVATSRIL